MANFPITYSSLPINDLPEPSFRRIEVSYSDEPRRKVLQLSSCAGGFTYSGCDNFRDLTLRSRFIIWRYDEGRLELIEYSTDYNLEGNAVRLDFINCQLVGRISIFESEDFTSVNLVIPTSIRIVRLTLPHPYNLQSVHAEKKASIFQNVTPHILADTNTSFSLPQTFLSQTLVSIATSLINDRVVCVMGSSDGSVSGVRFPTPRGEQVFTTFELKQTGIMSRILSGFMPTAMRKSDVTSEENTLSSMRMIAFQDRTYLLQLFRDCKLKLLCLDTKECMLSEDLSHHLHGNIDPTAQIEPSIQQNNFIIDGAQKFVILIATSSLAVFLTYELHLNLATPLLQHISTNFSSLPKKSKLVQFTYSQDNISTLWLSQDEFPIVQTCCTDGKSTSGVWVTSHEPSPLPTELDVPAIKDIQESYLNRICSHRYMNVQTILKALNLFNCNPPQNVTRVSLKTAIIQAVEKELHHLVTLPHLQNQSRRELQTQVWSKFYQACLQYQAISCYPLGILCERGVNFVIGKRSLLLYRPMQLLEQMYYLPNTSISLHATRILSESLVRNISSVIYQSKKLTNCFVNLDVYLNDLLDNDVDLVGFIGYLLDCMLISDREVCRSESHTHHPQLRSAIGKIRLLVPAFRAISDLLKLPIPDDLYTESNSVSEEDLYRCSPAVATLFTSDLGISILNMVFRDSISMKKDVCWSVLLLACFILREKDPNVQSQKSESFDTLKNLVIPDLISSLTSLHLMQQMSEYYSTSALNNSFGSSRQDIINIPGTDSVSRTLPLQFISSKCIRDIQYKLHSREIVPVEEINQSLPCLTYVLSEYSNAASEILAPGASIIKLLAFLLEQRYLCELLYALHVLESLYNPTLEYPIRYYKAQYYLKVGRVEKSTQIFLSTIPGLLSANPDPFLSGLISEKVGDTGSNATVLYCLNLIDLFEQEQSPDMIIQLAKHAVEIAPAREALISNLWSIQFKHSLDLSLYEDAYIAMLSNPEPSRRKDCMKRFVIELCSKNKFKLLCTFPYSGVGRDIEDVLESRARSVDVTNGTYYKLLHSFYTNRGNYRRAAVAMYECAMRLSGELPTLSILDQQAKCYLAAINALYLVDEKSAFVVKPPPPDSSKNKPPSDPPNSKKKRENHDTTSNENENSILTTRVKVMSIRDVENEYLIVLAQLRLAGVEETATPLTTSSCTHEEIQILLVQYGLFDMAMTISQRLNLSMQYLFECLTTRCVKMCKLGPSLLEESGIMYTQWLFYNDIGIEGCADALPPEKQAWELLKRYLGSLENWEKIECLCWTVARCLALSFTLPQWLKDLLSRLAPEKLLCLYLKYSKLENAGEFAIDYIRAIIGDKKGNDLRVAQERFGLKFTLKSIDPETGTYNQVKLPYTYLDILLSKLKEMPEESHLNALYKALDVQIQDYFTEVKLASEYRMFLKEREGAALGEPPHLHPI